MSVSTEIWKKINWERKGLRLPAVGCRAARLLVTGLFATRLSVILGLAGQERHRSGAACNPIRAATVRSCEKILKPFLDSHVFNDLPCAKSAQNGFFLGAT